MLPFYRMDDIRPYDVAIWLDRFYSGMWVQNSNREFYLLPKYFIAKLDNMPMGF